MTCKPQGPAGPIECRNIPAPRCRGRYPCFPLLPGPSRGRTAGSHAVTEDIDVAAFRSIAVALDDRLDPALADALSRIGSFVARPSLHRQPTGWRDSDSGTLVELLTPNEGPDSDEPVELPALGAFAQPLRFLDYLIHQPVQAAALYRAGVLINVPQPARYAIHKLIVATRRESAAAAKAAKDIAQATALIQALADHRPDELEEAFAEARDRGPTWRGHLDRGLRRLSSATRETLRHVTG